MGITDSGFKCYIGLHVQASLLLLGYDWYVHRHPLADSHLRCAIVDVINPLAIWGLFQLHERPLNSVVRLSPLEGERPEQAVA